MHTRAFSISFAMALAAVSSAVTTPARAQTEGDGTAGASLQVITPLSVTITQTLSFGRLQVRGGSGPTYVTIDPTAAVRRQCVGVNCLPGPEAEMVAIVRGEPNRSYRITLPASTASTPGSFKVSALKIVSKTRGNEPINGYGRLNAMGMEEVRIGGTLVLNRTARIGVYTANVPIAVLYE
jgi:hypothetical protein